MESGALSIFEYLDYREFLRDFYREQKQKHFFFSFRFLSQKTKIDPAHIARVFQCKRHLSEKSLAPFIALCKFNDEEKRYFDQLVAFNMARTERQARQAFEALLSLSSVKSLTLRPEQYGFYTKWYYTAVRALIAMRSFTDKDCSRIAQTLSPPITASQAREAVKLLLKLGLVRKGPDGILGVTDAHITTGAQWRSLAVNAFQAETLRLARESLDRHEKELRDISTVTIGIKRDRMDEIRQRIAEFRKSIIHCAEEDQEPDDVYQLNIQLFPLTDTSRKGRSR
jgi:uncharacterized protein (TIGR02147 family)